MHTLQSILPFYTAVYMYHLLAAILPSILRTYTANHSGLPYQYVVSLYWAAATTTTVGYGDISARTDLERIYAIFIMIVGVLAYGYIIASVAAGLTNADSGRAQYQEKLNAVKSYMSVSRGCVRKNMYRLWYLKDSKTPCDNYTFYRTKD